jgi:hypothetical protein
VSLFGGTGQWFDDVDMSLVFRSFNCFGFFFFLFFNTILSLAESTKVVAISGSPSSTPIGSIGGTDGNTVDQHTNDESTQKTNNQTGGSESTVTTTAIVDDKSDATAAVVSSRLTALFVVAILVTLM